MPQRKKPKRRDAASTKAAILAAAQVAFAEQGYAQAGIRDIAATAGITSPMLLRYFGSKAGLLEAVLIDVMRIEDILVENKHGFGERLSNLFADITLDIKAPSVIALSVGHPDASSIATHAMEKHVVAPLAKWLGPPHARVRALQIIMLGMGFVLCTRQLPLMSARQGIDGNLVNWLAQSVQAIVDQSSQ